MKRTKKQKKRFREKRFQLKKSDENQARERVETGSKHTALKGKKERERKRQTVRQIGLRVTRRA